MCLQIHSPSREVPIPICTYASGLIRQTGPRQASLCLSIVFAMSSQYFPILPLQAASRQSDEAFG